MKDKIEHWLTALDDYHQRIVRDPIIEIPQAEAAIADWAAYCWPALVNLYITGKLDDNEFRIETGLVPQPAMVKSWRNGFGVML